MWVQQASVKRRSFMVELKATLRTAGDRQGLSRCGIMTDFSAKTNAYLTIENAQVTLDNSSYGEYWRLVFNVIRSKSASMVRHVVGLPEMTAGLVHTDAVKVTESLSLFKPFHKLSRPLSCLVCRE